MKNMKKSHHNSKTNHKNLISRWVRVTIWYKLFSWSKIPRKKFFHKNFLMREFSPSDIWIDVFRKPQRDSVVADRTWTLTHDTHTYMWLDLSVLVCYLGRYIHCQWILPGKINSLTVSTVSETCSNWIFSNPLIWIFSDLKNSVIFSIQ